MFQLVVSNFDHCRHQCFKSYGKIYSHFGPKECARQTICFGDFKITMARQSVILIIVGNQFCLANILKDLFSNIYIVPDKSCHLKDN